MYAIATMQIHKVKVQSNSVVIGAEMSDIWELQYTSTKINQLEPVKVIQSHLLFFHPNLIVIKKENVHLDSYTLVNRQHQNRMF